ncbi:neutral alpha-glucosidase AB-like [Protopterus annectens]|uniref:neutral alpha-glucosidase AB-like n=1 Tax=Protopterus annectens TaxID=7888 RepID=UPI001CFAFBDA|nr:neutral alpha-glucosidase AB-like [Protopterus annectens]
MTKFQTAVLVHLGEMIRQVSFTDPGAHSSNIQVVKHSDAASSAAAILYVIFFHLALQNYAEGDLFEDDGHTFNFEKKNAYIHKKYIFSNNSLSSRSADVNGQFATASWIERVVIMGAARPTSVHLTNADGSKLTLDFEHNAETSVLTIRKPAVNTATDWTISLL